MREPGAEALAGRAFEPDPDRVVGQPGVAVALGDLARQHGAGRPVDAPDRQVELDRLLLLERLAAKLDQRPVEHLVELVVLPLAIADGHLGRHLRLMEQAREVEPLGLPMIDRLALIEHLGAADHLGEAAEAERGHVLAHLLGDEEEVIDHMLGLALEARAQDRVLRGDADRAGVEMALAHHDAACGDQRRSREAELVGAEQRADHHVAPRAHAAIDLHRDAAAQAIQH